MGDFDPIVRRHAELGGDAGLLGAGGGGEEVQGFSIVQAYQHGLIAWTPDAGAREVHGSILATWAMLGAERSVLGYPTSDEFGTAGGRQSDFERGWITWTAATGAVRIGRWP